MRLFPRHRELLFPIFLVALIALVFGRCVYFQFVLFDDDLHILRNPFLKAQTLPAIQFFWKNAYEGFYIPVTYSLWTLLAGLGRALGRGIQGIDPLVFHTANLVLHAINTVVLFYLLRRLLRLIKKESKDATRGPIQGASP